MQNFMKTIISAVKIWTDGRIQESFADWNENSALDIIMEIGVVEPLAAVDGTIYTSPDGDIYTL